MVRELLTKVQELDRQLTEIEVLFRKFAGEFVVFRQSQIQLCDADCTLWHSKQFVMDQLGISESTLYRWINDGLRISLKGKIWCPWIREYLASTAVDLAVKERDAQA